MRTSGFVRAATAAFVVGGAAAVGVGAVGAGAVPSLAGPAGNVDPSGGFDASGFPMLGWGSAAEVTEAIALKCGRLVDDPWMAVVQDGVVIVEPTPMGVAALSALPLPAGDGLATSDLICRPELERLGVSADVGFYLLTRETGAHLLRDALSEVHALQEAHWNEEGRWAGSLEALGFALPDPRLALEIEVRDDGEMWTGRGTHTMGLHRCAVYGWGALRNPVAVERNSTPQCARIPVDDDAFPRLAASPDG